MAVSACVVTGTLNADTTAASFTRSGFGTPEAALVFVGRANTGGNPTTTAAMSIGFWDGTNQYCAAVVSNDAVGDSDTARRRLNNRIAADISISGSTVGNLFQAQLATTTDGVTITITDDNTTVSRYATVVLFKGLSSKKLGNFTFAGDTSAIDVTTVGFKPDLVFYCDVVDGAAWTTSPSDQTDGALLIFGAAHNDSTDTITQGSILYSAVDALGSSRVNLSTGNTIGRQGFYDSNWFSHTISAFDSSGFTVTPSLASASRPMFLALEFDNPDDAYVGIVDSKTSTGTQAHTGTGFTPQILILASTGGTTVNGSSSSPTGSFFIGAGDSTAEQALVISDEDAQGTTDTESYANTSNILALRFHGGTTDAIADIDSLDSDGWTLNYSDGSSSTIKILAIAVGNSSSTTTVSADSSQSYKVRADVSQDQAGSYAVRANVSQDSAQSYKVRATVSADTALSYTVRAAVSQDTAQSYLLRANVQQDTAQSYIVRANISQDSAQSYKVRANVSQDLAQTYEIINAGTVSSDLGQSYKVLANVSQDAAQTYHVRAAVSQDAAQSYIVRQAVQQDSAQTYLIRESVTVDLAGTYDILVLSSVYVDLSAAYSVNGWISVSSDLSCIYAVGGLWSKVGSVSNSWGISPDRNNVWAKEGNASTSWTT